jgi:hypothetical protein
MNQPALQQIRDDLAFMDSVALAALPALLETMPASSGNVAQQMKRAAQAAYDFAAIVTAERRLRHETALCHASARRTA